MFYEYGKSQPIADQLSWNHYIELLPLKNNSKINYYISQIISLNLSRNELRTKIKNNEYERLDKETKNKLKNKEKLKVPDLVKNPIQIKNTDGNNEISEKYSKN